MSTHPDPASPDPPRHDLLVRVAKMYYLQGLSQSEIAEQIGQSRSNVSKLLQGCRESGIVEIRINETSSIGRALEVELQRRFGLQHVSIVPTGPDAEETKVRLGTAAARFLETRLRDGLCLGISWGSSLFHMVEACAPPRGMRADVVQLMGGLGARDLSMDGINLAYRLSGKLRGRCRVIQAPLIVQSGILKDLLLQEPDIRATLETAAGVDIAFVGIGSSHPEASALVRSGYLTAEESEELLRIGAVGNVLGEQIDVQGHLCPVPLNERVVGLGTRDLKKIPLVVGVAAGAPKAEVILGALRGRYINALVTDEEAALGIRREIGP